MTAGNSFIYSDLGDEKKDREKYLKKIGEYFEDVSSGLLKPVIDHAKLDRFCQQISLSKRKAELPEYLDGFPHVDGFACASVFKKLANFIVLFCENCPIEGVQEEEGGLVFTINVVYRNYENTSYALNTALSLLKGVEIERPAPEPPVILTQPIKLSQHSFDGAAEILQDYHMRHAEDVAIYGPLDEHGKRRRTVRRYKYWAYLLEQMTYVPNPDARYADSAPAIVASK
jgi:hypothetical protein